MINIIFSFSTHFIFTILLLKLLQPPIFINSFDSSFVFANNKAMASISININFCNWSCSFNSLISAFFISLVKDNKQLILIRYSMRSLVSYLDSLIYKLLIIKIW